MANSLNKQLLLGNVGQDPRIGEVGEKKVAQFSVATTRKFKDRSGQTTEQTEWHNIVAWSPLAEICQQYVKKGSRVYVEGETRHREYQTRDGETRTITEVVASQLILCDSKQDNGGGRHTAPSAPAGREYYQQNEPMSQRQPAAPAAPVQSRPAQRPAPAPAPQTDFGNELGIGADGAPVADDLPF